MMNIQRPITRRVAVQQLLRISGIVAASFTGAQSFGRIGSALAALEKKGFIIEGRGLTEGYSVKKLVKTADIVIESFPPGYMKTRGLGYDDLCRIKPDIILTSITPFGQEGPYKNFQASDLVCWSMGGFAYLTGDSDRPPVQVSFPQAYLAGANEGATATMVALYYREISGRGQHVDVSIQASVAKDMMNAPFFWEAAGVNLRRAGPFRIGLNIATGQKVIWKCKDGEVSFFFWGGKAGARTNRALVECMEEDGMAPTSMREMEWETFDMATAPEELFNDFSHHMGRFFQAHTKRELFQKAVKKKMTRFL